MRPYAYWRVEVRTGTVDAVLCFGERGARGRAV